MRKFKLIGGLLLIVGIITFSVMIVIQNKDAIQNLNTKEVQEFDIKNMAASANMIVTTEEENNEKENLLLKEVVMETAPASVIIREKSFDEMSLDELNAAIYNGSLKMEYQAVYTSSSQRLTKSKGAQYFNGHKETYYSQRVLPGNSLKIPGRHVADDGTVRDGDGYICVAADPGFKAKGTILITSLGPAKVYDTGCAYGTIDIYVNW